jgi:hypothetical protein
MAMAQALFNKNNVVTGDPRVHTRTFRNNFWMGFSDTIADRLDEAYKVANTAVAYTGSQELVLASRKQAVDDWVNQNLRLGRGSGYDSGTRNMAAQNHGRIAAKTVDISGGSRTNIGTSKPKELN